MGPRGGIPGGVEGIIAPQSIGVAEAGTGRRDGGRRHRPIGTVGRGRAAPRAGPWTPMQGSERRTGGARLQRGPAHPRSLPKGSERAARWRRSGARRGGGTTVRARMLIGERRGGTLTALARTPIAVRDGGTADRCGR